MSLLKDHYKQVRTKLVDVLELDNIMQVPVLEKVTLNMGVGRAISNKKEIDLAVESLTKIACQKPLVTVARKSIAGFKIRQGFPIGCKVTLRRATMWNFLSRLMHIALPRTKDFQGLSEKSFDDFGNYNFGVKEEIIFPEIHFDSLSNIKGFDVCLTIQSLDKKHSLALLKEMGFPFKSKAN